jgi:PKD repeat protein
VAGQQVSFADTSTDSDGTIAARAWDLDNDGAFDDGTGTSAQTSFAAAGSYTVRLQVTDDDGAPSVATRQVVVAAAPPPPANLLSNPSFETNTSGWGPYQSTLAREAQAGAPDGAYVVKVTRSSGSSFTIDDGARAVKNLVAGTTYSAEVWVKAASASAVGKPIQIKLRERTASGSVVADVGSANIALTTSWQKLSVSRTVVTAGGDLGLRVSQSGAVAGDAFYADAAVLRTGA